MKSAAKVSSALLVAAALMLACRSEAPTPTKVAAAPAEDGVDPVTDDEAVAPAGAPKITADEAVYEFGTIKATDTVEHVFKVRNAGDADLKIERVRPT